MTMKHVWHPDPKVMRDVERARARDGVIDTRGCKHPMSAMQQFVDVESDRDRDGRPTNLFQCGVCGALLWLSDANGREASEG
jgi:hypothetical protein